MALISLARAGVGKLILLDFDRVDLTNLHRQQYKASQIGQPKALALADNLREANPYLALEPHVVRVTEDNLAPLLAEATLVCEAFDQAEAKAMLVNAVLEQRAARVKETIDSAEASKSQAEELRAEYEDKLTDARQEAAKLVADAQNRAQRAYEAKMADAETDAKRLRSEAEAQIASERDAMLRGARNEVASLALLAAAKVAQRPTEDGDRALVDSFLAEVGEQA